MKINAALGKGQLETESDYHYISMDNAINYLTLTMNKIFNKSSNLDKPTQNDVGLKMVLDTGKRIRRQVTELTTSNNIKSNDLSLDSKKGAMVSALLLSSVQNITSITTNENKLSFEIKKYNQSYIGPNYLHDNRMSVSESGYVFFKYNNPLQYEADKKAEEYLNKLRLKLSQGPLDENNYIDTLIHKLEIKSWPLDFLLLKNKFNEEKTQIENLIIKEKAKLKKISSRNKANKLTPYFGYPIMYNGLKKKYVLHDNRAKVLREKIEIEQKKLSKVSEQFEIIKLLHHPDNVDLPILFNKMLKKLDYLYSEKNRLYLEYEEYQQHLKSLPQNGNPVVYRYILAEREKTKLNLSDSRSKYHIIRNEIYSIEKAANIEISQYNPKKQASLESEIERIASELEIPKIDKQTEIDIIKNSGEILDKLILSGLLEHEINIDILELDQVWSVHFYQGANVNGIVSFSNTEQKFSLRQILLGEADRSIFHHVGGSQNISKIYNPYGNFSNEKLIELINNKRNRLSVADEVMSNIEGLVFSKIDNIDFMENFRISVYGSILNMISESSREIKNETRIYQHIIDGFIGGMLQPSTVLFKGNVVPGLLALGDNYHNLIFSLSQHKVIISSVFQKNKDLPQFIYEHLPKIEQEGFIASDLENIKHVDDRLTQKWNHRLTFIERNPNIAFQTEADPYQSLFKSIMLKKLSDLNGVIYTSHEKNEKLANDMQKILIESAEVMMMLTTLGASSLWIASTEFITGISLKLANMYLDIKLIENADRGADLERAKKSLMSGKVFLAINLAKAPKLMIQAIGKGLDYINEIGRVTSKRLLNPLVKYSAFRDNRGGDYLAATAFRYNKLDQLNFPLQLKKNHPSGLCHGLSLEVLQRLEQSSDPQKHLFMVVNNLKEELEKQNSWTQSLLESIDRKQTHPSLFKTQKYTREPSIRYKGEHQILVRELENDILSLNPGNIALIRAHIKKTDGSLLSEGHIIMAQCISSQQFELFDANNGVFSYSTQTGFKKALASYFSSAYRDQGLLFPGSLTRFVDSA